MRMDVDTLMMLAGDEYEKLGMLEKVDGGYRITEKGQAFFDELRANPPQTPEELDARERAFLQRWDRDHATPGPGGLH